MLIREATIAQTTPQLRIAYDQFFMDLTPEQQRQVNFDQVQTDVHKVVRKQRDLNLGVEPMTRADTIKEVTRVITKQDSEENKTRSVTAEDSVDCGVAITMVVIDSVMVVLQAVGLPGAIAERSAARLANTAAPMINRYLVVFTELVGNVSAATTVAEKAKAYYAVFVAFTRTYGVKAIFKEVRNSMHWYDWLILGIIILLQVLLLIATDGAAIILQIAMLIVSLVALGVAVFNAVNACSLQNRGRSAPEIVNKGMVLLPGETLKMGEKMESANGAYSLRQSVDGNTTLYNSENQIIWQTGIKTHPTSMLVMSKEGNLALKPSPSSTERYWAAFGGTEIGNYALLDNAGRLVVINSIANMERWRSN